MVRLLEIGCGSTPIEWTGETAQYVGIDPTLNQTYVRSRAKQQLENNKHINEFALLLRGAHDPVFDEPPKTDEVVMRSVLAELDMEEKVLLVMRALHLAGDLGRVVAIEPVYPGLEEVAEIMRDREVLIKVDVLRSGTNEFDELWGQRVSSPPGPAARIMIAQSL